MIIARLFDLIVNDLDRKNLNALDFSSIGLVYKESKPTGHPDGKNYSYDKLTKGRIACFEKVDESSIYALAHCLSRIHGKNSLERI